jgi:membrane protease subunit HflK
MQAAITPRGSGEEDRMPWSNQGGGGGGGPWRPNNGGDRGGPWGGGGGGGGNSPQDFEEMLRRGQRRLQEYLPGAPGGGPGAKGVAALVLVGALAWLLSGFYTVQPNEVGINQRFGAYVGKTGPGLNYNWPYPVGSVTKLKVTDRNSIDVGSRVAIDRTRSTTEQDVPEESLMLTGDENIADVKFRVVWQIDPVNPEAFLFNLRAPQETVKAVAESAMREIVGRTPIQRLLTAERKVIEPEARDLIQRVLNGYKTGVQIVEVQLLSVDPPAQVISAFRDVTAAQQDSQRLRNEAEAYANRVVPEARGEAARIERAAEAYRQQTVAEAKGQTSRFEQVLGEYSKAPDVTRERLYLETMEKVLGRSDKTILAAPPGSVVPYLPLPGLDATRGQTAGGQK